jgi:hypothetical protein
VCSVTVWGGGKMGRDVETGAEGVSGAVGVVGYLEQNGRMVLTEREDICV